MNALFNALYFRNERAEQLWMRLAYSARDMHITRARAAWLRYRFTPPPKGRSLASLGTRRSATLLRLKR